MNELFKNDIDLDQKNHRYILAENPEFDFQSVTEFIHHFFEKFDKIGVAQKLINTNPKYSGKTIEQVIKDWSKGAERGTIVHNELEMFIKKNQAPEHKMSIMGANWIKEKQKNPHNTFYSEVIVFSKELGIAGTIDVLVYNSEQDMYHLVDWKTNKRIDKNSFRKKKGILESSKHLDDCNFNHYSLQLTFYRYILERYYGLEIGSQTLFHLKEDNYEIFNVDYKSEDLISMLREKELI
tara:strand:+ start:5033 stop:5746 length:714 start_codon:yes stop_codon:yes gene_type:complete